MGFLAAAAPAIGSLAGGLIGKAAGVGGPSPQMQTAMNTVQGNANQLGTMSGTVGNLAQGANQFGQNFAPGAMNSLSNALQYWTPQLNGSGASLYSALGPQINQINKGYDTTLANVRELTPRGGGATQIAGNLPFEKLNAITNLFQGQRNMAAGQVGDIGKTFADLVNRGYATSGSLYGTAGNQLSQSGALASGLLGNLLKQQQTQNQAGSSFGKGLFGLLNSVPGLGQNAKSGGGSVSSVAPSYGDAGIH